jgi:hypothetical protein
MPSRLTPKIFVSQIIKMYMGYDVWKTNCEKVQQDKHGFR